MKSAIAIALLLPIAVSASSITVGDTALEIPTPQGFAAVTPKMTAVFEFQKKLVAPTNEQLIAFIPETAVPAALQNKIPDLTRNFTVQAAKSIVNLSASSSDFSKLKQIVKTQNEDLLKKAEKDLPGIMGKINEGITETYDVNLALSVSQMVPLPPHYETDRALSYSAYVKYSMEDASGNPAPYVAAMTVTFVHIKGKILFLYSYADEKGLEWSREASKKWGNAVVEANPSSLQSSMKESLPPAVTRIDWGRVGEKAAVGAFIGLVIGLIGWAANRGKSS